MSSSSARSSSLVAGLVFLILVGGFARWSAKGPPAPVPSSAPDSVFSAERAMRHVRAIAVRPHPIGGADHDRVRDYVVGELAALGLTAEIQRTTAIGTRFQQAGRVENVLARLPGTAPGGPAVMLASHYDGVGAAPAASDAGSGTAVLIETLRALKAGAPLQHDVIALFTDGEEAGLLGAAAFVREHPWARDVKMILNFEARGTGGQAVMFQTGPGNYDQVSLLADLPHAAATSLAVTVYQFLPNDTDLSEFFALGTPALNFAFADGVERYHTSEDDADHIDPGAIQQEGGHALALSRAFGRGPLPRPATGNAVFFEAPFLGLIVYPEAAARPLAVVTLVLVVGFFITVIRSDRRWLLGLVLGLLGTVVAVAAGGGLAFLAGRQPPAGLAAWGPAVLFATALATVGAGVTLLTWALVRRWATAAAAALGPLLVWTILAVLTSWRLAGVSYVLVWPVLATALVGLAWRRLRESPAWLAVRWVPALVTLTVLVPVIYGMGLVAVGVTGPGGIAIGGLVPLALWLLAADLEAIAAERRWRVALAVSAVGVILIGLGLRAGRADTSHPIRSVLGYAEAADSGSGWLVTAAGFAPPGSWNLAALGPEARLVSTDSTGSDAAGPSWLTRLLGRSFPVMAAPAPRAGLAAPTIAVLADTVTPEGRSLTFSIRPAPGTEAIALRAIDTPVLATVIDGRPVDPSQFRHQAPTWSTTYSAPPDSGFSLGIVVPPTARPVLEVTAQSPGLPALPGVTIPPRPARVLPSQTGDLSVVYRRVALDSLPRP
ncbi:MAG: M28 family peptidase [Gemmatimonadales bacterium]|nr:M28 family peptidase [Gemmatimonadales bacterium]